jgi:acetyl-CoA carboxylase carboxyl transferase subunit alpha
MAEDQSTSKNGAAKGFVPGFEKPLDKLMRYIAELEALQVQTGRDHNSEIRQLRSNYVSMLKETYSKLTPWETVQVARHPQRPLAGDYISRIVKDFVEVHGDRAFGDDRAIRCGFGRLASLKVMVVAQFKGRETKEKIECNFGCAHPEGYRKALRAMQLAEKFGLPVVSFIDTPGAYPGVSSEERGVAEAIAVNLREMSRLRTPIVCVVIGEGGSGGALGIGVGDRCQGRGGGRGDEADRQAPQDAGHHRRHHPRAAGRRPPRHGRDVRQSGALPLPHASPTPHR